MFLLFAVGIAGCVLYKHRSADAPIISIQALAQIGNADRYFFIGYIMALWTLILCLESGPFKRKVAGFLLVLSLLASMTNFQWASFTDFQWRDTVMRYGLSVPTHPIDEMSSLKHIPINPPSCYIESRLAANVVADFTFSFPILPPVHGDVYNQFDKKLNCSLQKGDIVRVQVSTERWLEEDDRAYLIICGSAGKPEEFVYHIPVVFPSGRGILEREVKEPVPAPVLIWRNWKPSGSSLPETKIRICIIRPFRSVWTF